MKKPLHIYEHSLCVFNVVVLFLRCCLLPLACSELSDICCNDTAEDDGICLTFVQVYYTATLIPQTLTIERTASLLSAFGTIIQQSKTY